MKTIQTLATLLTMTFATLAIVSIFGGLIHTAMYNSPGIVVGFGGFILSMTAAFATDTIDNVIG